MIYSTAATAGGYGILEGDSGTTGTVSHSEIYGSFAYAVAGGGAGGSGLGAGSSITLYANLIDISQANNIGMAFAGSTGNIIYNNSVYGPLNTNAAVSQTTTSTGALVKNKYSQHGRVRDGGCVVGNRHGVRLQRLLLGVGHAVQLGRDGVYICKLENQ